MLIKKVRYKLYNNRLTIGIHRWFRKETSRFRSLPNFLVIGVQKGGTTSLYSYLAKHSELIPPIHKEIFFFDQNYSNSLKKYKMNFPLSFIGRKTFEATPTYLLDINASSRIKRVLPDGKFVVLLRNPIDRAFSHYNHFRKSGREKRTFEIVVAEDLAGISQGVKTEELLSANNRFRYVLRGCYSLFLEHWLKDHPLERFMFVKSENFFSNTKDTYHEILQFLELQDEVPDVFAKENKGAYTKKKMSDELFARLEAFYQPYNQRLYELTGSNFNWF